ncbi:hypothetical protein [Hydrogenophaga sp. 2FB]|uniref:hypothetical protein n=1 Tax=Hydrogenophaga sp. 2FB TaxID=2502187 RepID=UPI0014855374|nr:hypothetical protein [Hydrogenophaga sp. 2FB]
MTEALLLFAQLVLFGLLLRGVWRMSRNPKNGSLGIFSYTEVDESAPAPVKHKKAR